MREKFREDAFSETVHGKRPASLLLLLPQLLDLLPDARQIVAQLLDQEVKQLMVALERVDEGPLL